MSNTRVQKEDGQNKLFFNTSSSAFKIRSLLSDARRSKDALSAYILATQAGEQATKLGMKKEYSESLLVQVEILKKNGAYNEAMAKNMEALSFFKDSEYTREEASCWRNLGIIYNFLGEHVKQLEYNIKCYEITKTLDDKHAELQILNNIGDNYLSLQDYRKALEIFQKNLANSGSDKQIKCVSLKNIGAAFYHQGKFDKAKDFFQQTLGLADEIKNGPLSSAANFYLGKINYNRYNYKESLHYLENSFQFAKEQSSMKREKLQILQALVANCLELNLSSKALYYHRIFTELNEELTTRISNQTIKNLQFKFEIQEIEKEKEVLSLRNTLLQRANEKIELQKKELELKSKQLETANEELRNFAHIVSHDIKEPIRTIHSFSALLRKELKADISQKAKEFLAYVETASNRLEYFISDILNYTTAGQAEIKASKTPVDCNDLLVLIESNLQLKIQETRATIVYDQLPTLMAHKSLLLQVFQNLISNAIKFQKQHVSPLIKVSAEEQSTHYLFRIQDNGIGIRNEHLGKVFNLFTRLNAKSRYEGSGIGLTTVKKIMNLYGGDIKVESNFGEGTTFILRFPKPDASSSSSSLSTA